MYLSPADEDRLRVFAAAELARRWVARGLRLNAPEAIALACDEMHLAARAGGSFDEVLAAGRRAVQPDELLPGVADLVAGGPAQPPLPARLVRPPMGAVARQRKKAAASRTPAADRALSTPTWSARNPMAGGPARKAA